MCGSWLPLGLLGPDAVFPTRFVRWRVWCRDNRSAAFTRAKQSGEVAGIITDRMNVTAYDPAKLPAVTRVNDDAETAHGLYPPKFGNRSHAHFVSPWDCSASLSRCISSQAASRISTR